MIGDGMPDDAQTERLHMLMEECGEVIQAAAKVLRFGFESYHPDNEPDPHGRGAVRDNRDDLTDEVTGLLVCIEMLRPDIEDITPAQMDRARIRKLRYSNQ